MKLRFASLLLLWRLFLLLGLHLTACRRHGAKLPDAELLECLADNDQPLPRPGPSDWLTAHPEPGQTLDQYTAHHPADSLRHRIRLYVRPVGPLSEAEAQLCQRTAEYLQTLFQRPVVLLPPLRLGRVPAFAHRPADDGSRQLLAPYVLDSLLPPCRPADALATLGLTGQDIYPRPEWGYVFGLASVRQGVGVASWHRLLPTPPDSAAYSLALQRLCGTAAHETGHVLHLRHCTAAACLMNGSNSLTESDARPLRLCSRCQQKLHLALPHPVRPRLLALARFFRRQQWPEAYALAARDLQLAQEH